MKGDQKQLWLGGGDYKDKGEQQGWDWDEQGKFKGKDCEGQQDWSLNQHNRNQQCS